MKDTKELTTDKAPSARVPNEGPCQNTDRELWRERPGDYYADSIHVTEHGAIGINVGGHVIGMPVQAWHALASGTALARGAPPEKRCICGQVWRHDLEFPFRVNGVVHRLDGPCIAAAVSSEQPAAGPSSPSDLSARKTEDQQELTKALRIALGWAYRYLTQRGLKLHCPECHRVWDEGTPPQHDEDCALGTADAALTSAASAPKAPKESVKSGAPE